MVVDVLCLLLVVDATSFQCEKTCLAFHLLVRTQLFGCGCNKSKCHHELRTWLQVGGLIGDDEKCASRGVNGDNERVNARVVFSMVGCDGGALGGGDMWVFIQSFMDEVDGMEEVEVPFVDGVLEGAFGALGDEH